MVHPVLLCGGDGTRLWPASRRALPKQFMPLHGSTLFMKTVERAAHLPDTAPPLVLCNQEHRFLVAEQLRQALGAVHGQPKEARPGHAVPECTILLEPAGRNTAPAIALAALHLLSLQNESPDASTPAPAAPSDNPDQQSPHLAQMASAITSASPHADPLMLVLPSDQSLANPEALAEALRAGLPAALAGNLVTFGIVPTRPETGFGYIRQGESLGNGVFAAAAFVEKPDAERAALFMQSGTHFWNSGMFLFTASAYLRELALYAPAILEACRKAHAVRSTDLDFIRVGVEELLACPADSIDYAVMERTGRSVLVPLASDWSDLGSWQSLYESAVPDAAGNALAGDVLATDCRNSLILAQSRLVAAIGLEDMVVVETRDAVLVAPQKRSQKVRGIVAALKTADRREANEHARVYRPWGSYETLEAGDRFQVKRIMVSPGHRLSLQKHYHRAEHWVVVRGTALVAVDGEERLLGEDQSTYIPVSCTHRLENPGKVTLELIEIQTGTYLGEDDIIRLEDVYGR